MEAEIEEQVERMLVNVTARLPVANLKPIIASLSPIEKKQIVHRESCLKKNYLILLLWRIKKLVLVMRLLKSPKFQKGRSFKPSKL